MKRASSHTKPRSKAASSTSQAELLLEIGTEELPYQFIAPALSWLIEQTAFVFEFNNLQTGPIKAYGTPRRLVVVVEQLATHQTPKKSEVMGPSKAVAYDQTGQPTKAAIGFAKGQGVPIESLQVRETPKGEYLFSVKEDKGHSTKTVLPELLSQIVGELSFPKAMKWNEGGIRFARPIRWLVALFAGKVVPIEIAGTRASDSTYGHRVLGRGKPIKVRDYSTYSKGLERAGVIVDPGRRRTVIQDQLLLLCSKAGVALNADESLLDQAVYTTEWPVAVLGNFKPEYLLVPSEILTTSMKEHQGFFSVRTTSTGLLAPHFIAVANNQPRDMSRIRSGNERVLAARLADAKFFFDEDRKVRLETRVKKLEGVTFHQKLGTMAQKQDRVAQLAGSIAFNLFPDDHNLKRTCERAAGLSKADLLTGIVGEFPELQGIMGGEYARSDGEPGPVSEAIREQYLPRALEGELPQTLPGKILSMADRLDSIAAFFHVGMMPTGSEDPFALRRHATAIVRIILEGNLRLNLGKWIDHARNLVANGGYKGVADSETEGCRRIAEFLFERVRHYGRTIHGLRDDVIEAVLRSVSSDRAIDLVDLLLKMKALQVVTTRPEFDPLIIGFKRASRIVEKEQWDRKPVDPSLFKDPTEMELHREVGICRKDFDIRMAMGEYDKALEALVRLKPAIDAFFAGVMVNAEEGSLRSNRLSLLKDIEEVFKSFADFSRIMVQGG
ncbi:MAG TPA: glycine--tRNA ligase subunit beta [Nitrospira sp.]